MSIKKTLLSVLAGCVAYFSILAGSAALGKSDNHPPDLPNGTHLKTDICHNVDHNPVVVHVSVDSVDYPLDTGHGHLTLSPTFGFVSFSPHTGTGGHQHDFVLRVYTKHGNTEVNTYVNESKCEAETPPTTQPPVTPPPTTPPTTQPPVTPPTTQPPVTPPTTQPPVVVPPPPSSPPVTPPPTTRPPTGTACVTPDGHPYTTSYPQCPSVLVTPAPAPTGNDPVLAAAPTGVVELAKTGSSVTWLLGTGLFLVILGAGLWFARKYLAR